MENLQWDKWAYLGNAEQIKRGETKYERQDFDFIDNEVYHLSNFAELGRPKRGLWKWFTCIIVGVCVGLAMTLLTLLIEILNSSGYHLLKKGMQTSIGYGLLLWLLISLLYTIIAGLMTIYISPAASGSGIPEVKSYLNGSVHFEEGLFSYKTLSVKIFGVALALGGNLVLGKEGSLFVHACQYHIGVVHLFCGLNRPNGNCTLYFYVFFLFVRGMWKRKCGDKTRLKDAWAGILCKLDACLGFVYGSDKDRRDLILVGCAAGFFFFLYILNFQTQNCALQLQMQETLIVCKKKKN
ncbi:ClC family transporter: chloride ion channel [Reticulomyxa filosa]|uniref:ClC family transporter: chloride ion channel n=1 Tax=Reticulomyxa filosa TaxID=46433 RepID=X6MSD6_RETFI|nr:ClC family transporter: chloride ion channel [Reticulomyxa filosa]|eukprot:ETO16759.1 ClC family transporter: chloride ion channel [Reticulomyxa filosa]